MVHGAWIDGEKCGDLGEVEDLAVAAAQCGPGVIGVAMVWLLMSIRYVVGPDERICPRLDVPGPP